ncbi:Blue-light-activated protein [Planctomycetes bacterium Pan216]|uniref:histidine kinase n=1 Tax=Kolteria novifilia TaxID=2527975 RepID=A0A518B4F5_9BACT|nr:Blue-light-activated protein [Planctomycetes bacterium Pan216]
MTGNRRGFGNLATLFVIGAVSLALIVIGLAWWGLYETPENERRRIGTIQLRFLRQARDRIEDSLRQYEEVAIELASLPEVRTLATDRKQFEGKVYEATQPLELGQFHIRGYDASGEQVWEHSSLARRFPPAPVEVIESALKWSADPQHRRSALRSIAEPVVSSDSVGSAVVRICAPVWSEDNGGTASGMICLAFPVSRLFDLFLDPTRLLPESHAFVLQWEVGQSSKEALPAIVWNTYEPNWVGSRGRDANSYLKSLRDTTEVLSEYGEGDETVNLPGRDGRHREQVLAYVPIVFGTQRWILGLSTPGSVATENLNAQRLVIVSLALVALGAILGGGMLLSWQRERLETVYGEEQSRQLREVQLHYRELFAENPTAMLVIDVTGMLVDCNYSAERLLGRSRQEAVGKELQEFFEPGSIAPVWDSLQQKGNLHSRDTHLVRAGDRSTALAEIWGRKIGEHWILMANDVEQRRDLERQVARLRRMDSVGALTSTIAHDFNNLLGQVQILVSNVRMDVPADSEMNRDLAAIEEKVDDASRLVGNLMAFRDDVVSDVPIALTPLLNEFVGSQRKVLSEKINLDVDLRPELPTVWITPHSLRRVLDNLFVNANDAMPYGGTLTFRAYPRHLEANSVNEQLVSGDYLMVEVADTGSGMPPEILETIFEPFFTTKKDGKGTGLGLWTVYRIIRRAGGWVEVHSWPGRGTRFTLYLPNQPAEREDPNPGPPNKRLSSATTVPTDETSVNHDAE